MNIKRTITAVILAVAAVTPSALAAGFADTRGHWAEDIINELADKGVVNGISATEFNPDGTVTRAEFLRMALSAAGIETDVAYRSGECLDVRGDAWYAPTVQSALDKGLIPENMIDGYSVEVVADENSAKALYSGSFNAETAVTREEMAYLAQAALQYSTGYDDADSLSTPDDLSFGDVYAISAWAIDGVRHAYANSLISGMDDNTFRPRETATRAQAAVIIRNILNR
ncbi:MAG: S-layer homology domain-containing protein [Clostridia bacterium]|nr:S-layer homology domain-containing protein [Clostridia bacterium]